MNSHLYLNLSIFHFFGIITDNFPPKIVNASNLINATLGETVELNVTAEDEGSITFHVINKPAGATWNQTGNMLSFHWPVTSSQKVNFSIENLFVKHFLCRITVQFALKK